MRWPLILLLLTAPIPARATTAQVIDRMLAVVDGEVVTSSDLEDYRTLARGFGEELPGDDGVVLNQIIEDILISRQISQFSDNEMSAEQLDAYIAGFRDPGSLSPSRLRALVRRRLELERYYATVAGSLRPTDAEVDAVYEDEFVPRLRETGEAVIPSLDEVREQLEEIVVADKLVEEISARVEILRRRYRVEIVE